MDHLRKYIAILTSLLILQSTIGMVVYHHHCNTTEEHLISLFEKAECNHHAELIEESHSCCDHGSHSACNDVLMPNEELPEISGIHCCIDYAQYYSSEVETTISIENIKNLLNRASYILFDLSDQYNPFLETSSEWTVDDRLTESPHIHLIKSILKSSQRNFSSDSDSDPMAF
jgi:hypothetical protein